MNKEMLNLFPKLIDSKNRINGNILRFKNFKDIMAFVLDKIDPVFLSLPTKDQINIVLYEDEIDFKNKNCETCNKITKFVRANLNFTPFCSFKCSRKSGSSTFKKARITCLEKYGVKSNLALKEQIEANRIKWGGLGRGSKILSEKIKQTNIKNFGFENVFQSEEIKQKIRDTHNEKYGGNFQTMRLGTKIKMLEDE